MLKKKGAFVLLSASAYLLVGCVPFWKTQPLQVDNSIQPHESWCYQTLGEIDCYTTPQAFPPSRLVNVDPQSLRPLTAEESAKEVAARR